MAQLLVRNKPTTLICTGNPDHEISWDSDDIVFLVEADKKMRSYLEYVGMPLNDIIGEIIVWSRKFDFQTTYVGRKEDFDWIS
jgi:hypothetical protein